MEDIKLMEGRKCPVCGEIAQDGVDDQVVLWGWGVHNAESDSFIIVDKNMDDMVILHAYCLQNYVTGKLIKCKITD